MLKDKREPRRSSPFLALPVELRQRIYEFCFNKTVPIYAIGTPDARRIYLRPNQKLDLPVTLLRTNRQVHMEAAEFLYGNRIVLGGFRSLSTFINQISSRNALLLKYICVSITEPTEQLTGLGEFPSPFKHLIHLKEFLLGFNPVSLKDGSPKDMAALFYEYTRYWSDAWGERADQKDAVVDVLRVRYWFRWWEHVSESLDATAQSSEHTFEAGLLATYTSTTREVAYEKAFLKELRKRLLAAH